MRVYMIDIFDENFNLVCKDFFKCEDRQAAELKAERDADWLGCKKWEVTRIR